MLTKLITGERKGPKSRGKSRTMVVTALYHTYNRIPKKMGTYAVDFEAPVDASIDQLIDLAHRHGATVGDHSIAGVFELQTPTGSWVNPRTKEGQRGKLLTRSNSGVAETTTFLPARGVAKGAR